jgi:hypothetical protein
MITNTVKELTKKKDPKRRGETGQKKLRRERKKT